MAYNNMFQPTMQQTQPQTQTMLVSVNGEGGAQMYPVAAGMTVALIDFNAGMFWLKTTDPNGFPLKMREFKFEEITKPAPTDTNAVTRAEFDELKKMIAALGGKKDESA